MNDVWLVWRKKTFSFLWYWHCRGNWFSLSSFSTLDGRFSCSLLKYLFGLVCFLLKVNREKEFDEDGRSFYLIQISIKIFMFKLNSFFFSSKSQRFNRLELENFDLIRRGSKIDKERRWRDKQTKRFSQRMRKQRIDCFHSILYLHLMLRIDIFSTRTFPLSGNFLWKYISEIETWDSNRICNLNGLFVMIKSSPSPYTTSELLYIEFEDILLDTRECVCYRHYFTWTREKTKTCAWMSSFLK